MSALFASISWTNLALVVWSAIVLMTLWRWQRDKANAYDLRDLLLDHATNRASVDKHVVLGFAALSGWVVVSRQLDGKEVETLLLGISGIFICNARHPRRSTACSPKSGPVDHPTRRGHSKGNSVEIFFLGFLAGAGVIGGLAAFLWRRGASGAGPRQGEGGRGFGHGRHPARRA